MNCGKMAELIKLPCRPKESCDISGDHSQIWCVSADLSSTFMCQIPWRSVILSHSNGGNPHILPFSGLRRFLVSPIGGVWRKLNAGAHMVIEDLEHVLSSRRKNML